MALLVLIAVGVNRAGIGFADDVTTWRQWFDDHTGYFLAWRLCLYSITIYGWLWVRHRLRQCDTSTEAYQQRLRAEIGAIAAILLLEASLLLRQP